MQMSYVFSLSGVQLVFGDGGRGGTTIWLADVMGISVKRKRVRRRRIKLKKKGCKTRMGKQKVSDEEDKERKGRKGNQKEEGQIKRGG